MIGDVLKQNNVLTKLHVRCDEMSKMKKAKDYKRCRN